VDDSFVLYPSVYEKKWSVIKELMLDKLNGLTRFQLAALEIWAGSFWEKPDINEEGVLEKHLGVLLC